jgi:hypothetical protein
VCGTILISIHPSPTKEKMNQEMNSFEQVWDYVKGLEQRIQLLERANEEKTALLAKLLPIRNAFDVETEEMCLILKQLLAKLQHPQVLEACQEECNQVQAEGQGEDETTRAKLQCANKYVAQVQESFFELHQVEEGVEYLKHPHTEDDVEEWISKLQQAEERIVVVSALGQSVYDRNQEEEANMKQVESELQVVLKGGDAQAKKQLIRSIQLEANQVFTQKLNKASSQVEMMKIFETLNKEERLSMMRAEVLQRLMGAGHSHSHNGEACHGHGEGGRLYLSCAYTNAFKSSETSSPSTRTWTFSWWTSLSWTWGR